MEERDRKYTLAIRWVRARMKGCYPGGGARMTAALNLWHILRDTTHRHGCGFDWTSEYRWSTEQMLKSLFNEGLLEETELESLWDAMVKQLKVSHEPEDAPDYWKKCPTFKKKEKVTATVIESKQCTKKRGFWGWLLGK